jgi:hypothetical protein
VHVDRRWFVREAASELKHDVLDVGGRDFDVDTDAIGVTRLARHLP